MYFYRARYYDPQLKWFISSDPIGLSGELNLYAYVDAEPIGSSDPLGLKKTKGQKINDALQDLPESWCDIWPDSCYKKLMYCAEADVAIKTATAT